MVYIEESRRRAHKARNYLHSIILVSGMVLLTSACAWILWGPQGIIWALIAVGFTVVVGPSASPRMVMNLFRARQLRADEADPLIRIVEKLSQRAQLKAPPSVYLLPSTTLNAFAVGKRDDAAIAVSYGLLNRLSMREIAGVLAHEISHVRNNDLWTMNLADALSRLTQVMSYIGVFLFAINLPLAMSGQAQIPWLAVLLLYFAPTIGNLLQLALSRSREYDADLDGAHLSGDPVGLASALEKLERYQGRFWEDMLPMGRKVPVPSLLRTHPPTEERVQRLLDLHPERPALRLPGRRDFTPAPWGQPGVMAITGPGYRWPGVWF